MIFGNWFFEMINKYSNNAPAALIKGDFSGKSKICVVSILKKFLIVCKARLEVKAYSNSLGVITSLGRMRETALLEVSNCAT